VRAPLERLARDRFWRTFVELLALNLAVAGALMLAGRDLRTDAAPNGILSLQFAGSVEDVGRILQSWSPRARTVAAFTLGLDYLYMPLYAAGLSFLGATLTLAARRRGRSGLAGWVAAVAWLPWLAAAADAIENAAALEMVLGGPDTPWPTVVRTAALTKFALLAFVIGALLAGTAVLILRGWTGTKTSGSVPRRSRI
jgi:hypothetical protein